MRTILMRKLWILPWAVMISTDAAGPYQHIVYKDTQEMFGWKCPPIMDCRWQEDFVEAMNNSYEWRTPKEEKPCEEEGCQK